MANKTRIPFPGQPRKLLHQKPILNITRCRVFAIVLIALGILMLARYSIAAASVSTDALGLYRNQIEELVDKGLRVVSVVLGSSALAFFPAGFFTCLTGIFVFAGRRAQGLFIASIITTILFPSVGRLLDNWIQSLPSVQGTFTVWLMVGGLAILIVGNILVGREHDRVTE